MPWRILYFPHSCDMISGLVSIYYAEYTHPVYSAYTASLISRLYAMAPLLIAERSRDHPQGALSRRLVSERCIPHALVIVLHRELVIVLIWLCSGAGTGHFTAAPNAEHPKTICCR